MRGERLARYLARSGVASRRRAEDRFIAAGRVTLDGRTVTDPATTVRPGAEVRVDGRRVHPEEVVTLALHKPAGVLCTVRDPRGRLTVLDLVADPPARLYPVGRLDYDSEGLLLLSNDGPLAAALLHPRHAVPRRYALLVTPRPDNGQLVQLCRGVRLSDGVGRAVATRWLPGPPRGIAQGPRGRAGGEAWVEMVLSEGRNRQARRMCAALGLDVQRLVRVAIGPLQLGGLAPGACRRLCREEEAALRAVARGGRPPGRGAPPPAFAVGTNPLAVAARGDGRRPVGPRATATLSLRAAAQRQSTAQDAGGVRRSRLERGS